MAEFIFKRDDYTNPDQNKDKYSHKKGDLINIKHDGWSDSPGFEQSKYPQKFIIIKCPGINLDKAKNEKYHKELIDSEDNILRRHRYSISSENVDSIISSGGIIKLNKEQFLSLLIDHIGK